MTAGAIHHERYERLRAAVEQALDAAGDDLVALRQLLLDALDDEWEVEWLKATNKALLERHTRLVEALSEIESFPVSGYHAGEAQRIARVVLAEEPREDDVLARWEPNGWSTGYRCTWCGTVVDGLAPNDCWPQLMREAQLRHEEPCTRPVAGSPGGGTDG